MEGVRDRQSARKMLDDLIAEIGDCRRCRLHTTRTTIVFGEGDPAARVMFIGEGPGKEEDQQARPFVGRAGQLHTAIIEKGMQLKREDVFIANVVKCRPTVDLAFERDRPPDDGETAACSPFLLKQIAIIRPDVIVTLGNPSTKFLLKNVPGITKIRGTWFSFNGIPVMPTYHPSYILRNGGEYSPLKRDVWDDIKKVIRFLNGEESPAEDRKKEAQGTELPESLKDKKPGEKDVQGSLF